MDVSVEVSGIDRINGILEEYAKVSPETAGRRVKQMAFTVCDSFHAACTKKKSPKRLKVGTPEVSVARAHPYPTITRKNKDGGRVKLHRWQWTGHVGTPAQYTHRLYIYAKRSQNQEIRTLFYGEGIFKGYGRINHSGLAAKSWRWVKKHIHSGAAEPAEYKKTKWDKRDPRASVDGKFTDYVSGPNAGASALLDNKLDYIGKIVTETEQSQILDKAANKFLKKVELEIDKLTEALKQGTITRAQIRRLAELKTFDERAL